tara:strand:+ start:2532 stop:3614 length:1083 start_codon:yes stop_codon:yes gene_type:complete
MKYLITRSNIESNKAFQRLMDKTQVFAQNLGRQEVIKNRLTHSYEVATSAEIIASSISTSAFKADYKNSVYNVSMLHDIGHPPFGHDGATMLSKRFKDLGVFEGFSDNNNNFVVMKKNQIKISDYELASLIKYPNKLYESQMILKDCLRKAIDEDVTYFSPFVDIEEFPKRTLSCEIMDEADRNTYTCADLADCYSIGISDGQELRDILDSDKYFNTDILEFLTAAIKAIEDKNITLIKMIFSNLKVKFNQNYYLGKNLQLCPKDKEMQEFREELFKIDVQKYIFSDVVKSRRAVESKMLEFYIDYILENEFYPSKYYKTKIAQATSDIEKYTLIRDMIADTTDAYVTKVYEDKYAAPNK